MPKRIILLMISLTIVAFGLLLTAGSTRAVEAPNSAAMLKKPTATPTKRPTKTPVPSKTPGPTNTPRPSSTPNISGTQGVVPTAIQPPPVVSGGFGGPNNESGVLIDPLEGKLFVASGFPGVSTGLDDQGYYQYAKNRKSEPTLWAYWYLQVANSGYYDVYAYVPSNPNATHSARYTIFQNNTLSQPIVVDQTLSAAQWTNLGSYYFLQDAIGTQYVALTNQTSEDDTTTVVLCSTVFLVYRP